MIYYIIKKNYLDKYNMITYYICLENIREKYKNRSRQELIQSTPSLSIFNELATFCDI